MVGFDADNCISVGTDREFSFHKGTVRDIHFHDDRTMLSVGGGDNLLHLTDVEKGRCRFSVTLIYSVTVLLTSFHLLEHFKMIFQRLQTPQIVISLYLTDSQELKCLRTVGTRTLYIV